MSEKKEHMFERICILSLIIIVVLTSFTQSEPQTGKATYYASKFNGRRTSSGEIFNQKLFTAAHKSLPFGTIVRVCNEANDSMVIVKINDRLPQRSATLIDLSMAAAKQLNFVRAGIAKVTISVVEPEFTDTATDTREIKNPSDTLK